MNYLKRKMRLLNKRNIVTVFILFYINGYSQLISNELIGFENIIYEKLKEYEPGILKQYPDDEINNLFFATPLVTFNNLKFYKLGINANHSYKYIGMLTDDELKILPTKNFNEEFSLIISLLIENSDCKINSKETLQVLDKLYKLYSYNSNPPWKSRGTKGK